MRQIRVRNAECLTNEIIGAKTGHKAHKVRYSVHEPKTNIWHAVNSSDISMHCVGDNETTSSYLSAQKHPISLTFINFF